MTELSGTKKVLRSGTVCPMYGDDGVHETRADCTVNGQRAQRTALANTESPTRWHIGLGVRKFDADVLRRRFIATSSACSTSLSSAILCISCTPMHTAEVRVISDVM